MDDDAAPAGAAAARPTDRDLLDVVSDAVLLHGPDGRVERANRRAHELFGPDLVGADGVALWARARGPRGARLDDVENPLRVALATGRSVERVLRLQTPDGDVWLTVTAVPAVEAPSGDGGPGAPTSVTLLARVVEGDEAAVAAVSEREHLLSVAQQLAKLSIWRWPMGGSIEWLDGDGRGMGLPGENRSLTTYLDGIHPDDRDRHDELLGQLLTVGGSGEVDLRYRWEDGWKHWLLWGEATVDTAGAVTGLWGTTQDVTERREAEAAVRRLTMTDSLTRLANRAQAVERLTDVIAGAAGGLHAAVLVVDVDRFHLINDRHGHSVGDELLVEIGRRLAAASSDDVVPARMGADEFALVLSRTTPASATELAHRLRADLLTPYLLAGSREPVTPGFSLGLTVVPVGGATPATEAYRQADLSASAAKAGGGDRVVVFDAELRSRTVSRLDMETRLRAALAESSVFPLYQPVISLGSSRAADVVTSCEALARIRYEGQIIMPGDFVGVAEELGLIVDLDLSVMDRAVRDVLSAPPGPGFSLAVNLSPLSLQVAGVADRVQQALEVHGVSGRQLRVEITESCLAEPTSTLVENLRGLRGLGAKIGLDDFGTGYSALQYLRRFELDFMKIDRSFVADVCEDPRSASVVRAVVDLAHAHDLSVVAEGVETAEQLELLRDMSCDMAQGYHMGRPMPLPDLVRLTRA
jgi:diguanylate cyclase (GGDEF)-like protein